MRRAIAIIMLLSCLSMTGCWRRWVGPTAAYPIIPVDKYPEYEIPSDIKTEKDKAQVVDALFKAEKHAMKLRKRVEIYNKWARGKNADAPNMFE